jgi:hypothetical protein
MPSTYNEGPMNHDNNHIPTSGMSPPPSAFKPFVNERIFSLFHPIEIRQTGTFNQGPPRT